MDNSPAESRGRVLLAVSGSISAYKAADIVSQLVKGGYEVRCLLTESASQFVSPLVLETLSGHPVSSQLFGPGVSGTEHIRLARWADVVVFAPATAHLIAKLALGLADDLVTTVALATRAPWLVAPAMNTAMWENIATQGHVSTLRARAVEFIEPASGKLACGEEGAGKLETPEVVVARIVEKLAAARGDHEAPKVAQPITPPLDSLGELLAPFSAPEPAAPTVATPPRFQDLRGMRILMTAGPTTSALDAVRYVTNPSTGRMGAALAEEALARGAEVIYVLGIDKGVVRPQASKGAEHLLEVLEVRTAEQMLGASLAHLPHVDGVIATAAVLDYRVIGGALGKVKRGSDPVTLTLEPSVDVLGSLRAQARSEQWFWGFAAETDDVESYGRGKFEKKRLDFLFANRVAKQSETLETGFGTETNAGIFFRRSGEPLELGLMTKPELARKLWDRVVADIKALPAAPTLGRETPAWPSLLNPLGPLGEV